MKNTLAPLKRELITESSLKTLVENRTIYNLNNFELNLFETFQTSEAVSLKFNDLVVTSMIKGKKIMHLFDQPGFDYLPGESVIVPATVEMKIDFPDANMENTTQCLALAIDNKKIVDTLSFLNEKYPREGKNNYWKLDERNFFFTNNVGLTLTINKLISICQSNSITKDVVADLTLQELLITISQCQTLNEVKNEDFKETNPYLANIIGFIRQNLTQKLSLKAIANVANLSTASLYRLFKKEIGISPVEFIILERIKFAKKLLKDKHLYIKNVSFEAGFDDWNYFIRVFKYHEGITPKQYRELNNK
jgi:AraC-like DNA-binding protein